MNASMLFGVGTFFIGGLLHALFSFLWSTTLPPPQWLFLSVVALGAGGRTVTAETLGFFWGLMLDAQGSSLFGSQAWILATAGYLSGILSRRLDAEKLSAQLLMAVGATLLYFIALVQIELLFRWPGPPHRPGWGMFTVQFLMNILFAPAVFLAMRVWGKWGPVVESDHVFHR